MQTKRNPFINLAVLGLKGLITLGLYGALLSSAVKAETVSPSVENHAALQAPATPDALNKAVQEAVQQKQNPSSTAANASSRRYRLQFYPEISEEILKKAGLNSSQIGEFKSVEHAGRTMSRSLVIGIVQKRKDLLAYLNAPNAQPAEASARAEELAQQTGQLNALQVQNWFKLRALLKPAQLSRLASLLKDSWANDAQFSYNKP